MLRFDSKFIDVEVVTVSVNNVEVVTATPEKILRAGKAPLLDCTTRHETSMCSDLLTMSRVSHMTQIFLRCRG